MRAQPMAMCWICDNEEGTTGEHQSKRSDLKAVLGPNGGLFLHNDQRRNRRIQSIDSKLIKFKAPVCPTCNGARTQPHDLAWQALSDYLRTRSPAIKPGDNIRGNRLFPYDTGQKMLGVHLFFVKWLGCQIVETGIPIRPPVVTFAKAIMTGRAHPNLWLSFGCMGPGGSVGASNIDAASFTPDDGFDYLGRFYHVGRIAVRLRFSSIPLPDDWHPKDGNRLVIRDFKFDAEASREKDCASVIE